MKPAPCQGWYVAPVPTRNTRAAPGSQGTARPPVFPHYPRYLAVDREANSPVSASSPCTFLLAQLFLYRLGRSSCGGTTLDRNGYSPHQGLGGAFGYPNVPKGDDAFGLSTSTGHSRSTDINLPLPPASAPLPWVTGSDDARPCCVLHGTNSLAEAPSPSSPIRQA